MPTRATSKQFIPISQVRFPKGYVSTLVDSRIPTDALASMFNITLEQDSIPRPRPPFVRYGADFIGTCIGIESFIKMVAGKPQHWEISAQVVSGVTGLYIRKDGSIWSLISGSYTLDIAAWITFTQGAQLQSDGTANNRIYISNGVNNMSYYDIDSGLVVQYVGLATPGSPTVTPTGLTGSVYTQYYRISANNAGGESAASASGNHAISTARDFWTSGEYITLSWSAVPGATSYNIYTSDQSGQEAYLATVNGLSYVDNGSVAINFFKLAPNNDSSSGPIVTSMINIDNQLFGVGDPNNPSYLWYSGQGQHFGDFSFNPQGGGYVGIDYGGSTIPTTVFPFHDGKGNPVPSVLTHGPAGRGKLVHIQFTTTTVGTTTLTYPSVYEANAQDGCPSTRGVAIYNNNAYYCTGTAMKTTGTHPDIVNILASDSIFNQGLPDIQNLNLSKIHNYVNQEFLGKVYFALPVGPGSVNNNQIWILDLTRGGLWILYWQLADNAGVQHMWLYEDNSGATHFNILTTNNVVLELDLDRVTTPTQDDNVPFSTVLRSGAMTFDEGGVAEVASYLTYFKFLYPRGIIDIAEYGYTEDNVETALASDTIRQVPSSDPFVWGGFYSDPTGAGLFSADSSSDPTLELGPAELVSVRTLTIALEPDEIVSEQTWQITTDDKDCDYLLSSVTSTVYSIPRRFSSVNA